MTGTKSNPSPFDARDKAQPDEPYFTLLARDPLARGLVFLWCALKEKQGVAAAAAYADLVRVAAMQEPEGQEKVADAETIAKAMLQWRVNNPGTAAAGVDEALARDDRKPPA